MHFTACFCLGGLVSMRMPFRFLAVLACAAAFDGMAEAASSNRFLVSGNDGYGIADCLAEGASCGKAVADAYCEAQGFKEGALAYGLVTSDITASTTNTRRSRAAAFEIECRV